MGKDTWRLYVCLNLLRKREHFNATLYQSNHVWRKSLSENVQFYFEVMKFSTQNHSHCLDLLWITHWDLDHLSPFGHMSNLGKQINNENLEALQPSAKRCHMLTSCLDVTNSSRRCYAGHAHLHRSTPLRVIQHLLFPFLSVTLECKSGRDPLSCEHVETEAGRATTGSTWTRRLFLEN